jgi:hypothetical protein
VFTRVVPLGPDSADEVDRGGTGEDAHDEGVAADLPV